MPEFITHIGLTTIFLIIGGIGFLFLVVSFVVGDLFEMLGFDLSTGHDFGMLDSRVISIFLAAFGGFGLIGTTMGFGSAISSLFGLFGGLVFGAIVYGFGKLLYDQMATSSVSNEDLVGKTAQVTVAILPHQVGQVMFVVGEERVEKLARSHNNTELKVGAIVRVESFAGDSLLVRADKGEGFLLYSENS